MTKQLWKSFVCRGTINRMAKKALYIIITGALLVSWSCHRQDTRRDKTSFTKVDSLTETYLTLQDSLLHAWNVMAWDEKEKIKAMHNLIHLMHEQDEFDDEQLISLEQRLDQLNRIRYTQKTVANAYLIEEYDFASNSLISEILSMAESDSEFIKNESVQKSVDKVKMTDQRVPFLRMQYDKVAASYNSFLDANKKYLKDIDKDCTGEKISQFQSSID